MQLDIPTVMIMEVAAAALVGMILPSVRGGAALPGFREATLASWSLAAAFATHLARGALPDAITVPAGNILMWLGVALHVRSYQRFTRPLDRPSRTPLLAVAALGAGFVVLAVALRGGYLVRSLYASVAIATLSAAGAWTLLRDGGLARERSRIICVGLCGFTVLCMVVRVGLLLADPPPPDANLLTPSLERSIAFFPSLLFTLGAGLGFVVMHREQSETHARRLALTDPLTGCANRRALEDHVQRELAHATRSGRPVSVIVVDVDRFKQVNDVHGHAVGDQVIRHVASTLQRGVRTSDVVARYGGEEFCVVLRDADGAAAAALADRLRLTLRDGDAPGLGRPITASFGVADAVPGATPTWQDLFRRADAALYAAKQNGRDRVERG